MRKKKKEPKIYKIIDLSTGQVRYIGYTLKPLEERLRGHFYKATHGSKTHVHLWMKKVNCKVRIELIEIVPPGKTWQAAERKWIKYYRDHGYPLTNSTKGGDGTHGCHFKHSAATKRKISRAHLLYNKTHPRKPVGKETRKKLSRAGKGRKLSKETRQKQSRAQKKRYREDPMSHPWWGRHLSKEHKRKIGKKSAKRRHSKATKKKLSRKTKTWLKTHDHPMLGKVNTGWVGRKQTQEVKDIISRKAIKRIKLQGAPMSGKHHSLKTRRQMRRTRAIKELNKQQLKELIELYKSCQPTA